MIGALIGAGVGIANSIVGGIKSAKAAKAQKNLINEARQKNESWYNREYYGDYMERSDAQAAMKRVRDFMKRSNENVENTAAVMGSTPEAVIAQKEAANKVVSDTAAQIQANADAYKTNIQNQYNAREASLDNAMMGQLQADEAGASQAANNGLAMAGSIGMNAIGSQSPKVSPAQLTDYNNRMYKQSLESLNRNTQSVWGK